MPAAVRTFHTVDAAIGWPRPTSSLWMRRYPAGASWAIRTDQGQGDAPPAAPMGEPGQRQQELLTDLPAQDVLVPVVGPVGELAQELAHGCVPPGLGAAADRTGSAKASTANRTEVSETKLNVIVCRTWSLTVGSTCRCVWW